MAGKKGGEWVYASHEKADADELVASVHARCITGRLTWMKGVGIGGIDGCVCRWAQMRQWQQYPHAASQVHLIFPGSYGRHGLLPMPPCCCDLLVHGWPFLVPLR